MTIWFYSKSPSHSWLSNFSDHAVLIDGVRWPSVEHYYQAQKYDDAATRELIMSAATALEAKKKGSNRSLSVRSDWDDVKESVMRKAVLAKFEQHRLLRSQLLETGEEMLCHESNDDLFWGCTRDGIGENRLGKILIDLRSKLHAGERGER